MDIESHRLKSGNGRDVTKRAIIDFDLDYRSIAESWPFPDLFRRGMHGASVLVGLSGQARAVHDYRRHGMCMHLVPILVIV